MALAGERSEPVRLRSVTTMHALFNGQVERKVATARDYFLCAFQSSNPTSQAY
jgi:hypothetical protein